MPRKQKSGSDSVSIIAGGKGRGFCRGGCNIDNDGGCNNDNDDLDTGNKGVQSKVGQKAEEIASAILGSLNATTTATKIADTEKEENFSELHLRVYANYRGRISLNTDLQETETDVYLGSRSEKRASSKARKSRTRDIQETNINNAEERIGKMTTVDEVQQDSGVDSVGDVQDMKIDEEVDQEVDRRRTIRVLEKKYQEMVLEKKYQEMVEALKKDDILQEIERPPPAPTPAPRGNFRNTNAVTSDTGCTDKLCKMNSHYNIPHIQCVPKIPFPLIGNGIHLPFPHPMENGIHLPFPHPIEMPDLVASSTASPDTEADVDTDVDTEVIGWDMVKTRIGQMMRAGFSVPQMTQNLVGQKVRMTKSGEVERVDMVGNNYGHILDVKVVDGAPPKEEGRRYMFPSEDTEPRTSTDGGDFIQVFRKVISIGGNQDIKDDIEHNYDDDVVVEHPYYGGDGELLRIGKTGHFLYLPVNEEDDKDDDDEETRSGPGKKSGSQAGN